MFTFRRNRCSSSPEYAVDEEWITDPNNSVTEADKNGNTNGRLLAKILGDKTVFKWIPTHLS